MYFRVVLNKMVMEFHFALDWVSIFDYFHGSVIAYYYLIMPNFTVEESVVVFVLSSSKLQKYLVDNIIWLVNIINYFSMVSVESS